MPHVPGLNERNPGPLLDRLTINPQHGKILLSNGHLGGLVDAFDKIGLFPRGYFALAIRADPVAGAKGVVAR